MPITHGRLLSFWVSTPSGGASASLSGYTQEVNGFPGEQDIGDITVAGQVGHTSFPGLQKLSFTTKMVMDNTTGGSWAVLGPFQSLQQTYPTTPWGIIFGPAGTTAGYPKLTCNALIKSINMPVKVSDPNTFTVSWEMSAGTSGVTATTW